MTTFTLHHQLSAVCTCVQIWSARTRNKRKYNLYIWHSTLSHMRTWLRNSLQQHIQAAQTFHLRDKDKWTHRVLMINLSCDDQIFECQTHNLLATADQSPAHTGLIMANLALIYICYNNWQHGTVSWFSCLRIAASLFKHFLISWTEIIKRWNQTELNHDVCKKTVILKCQVSSSNDHE